MVFRGLIERETVYSSAPLSEPEADQQNEDKRRQKKPRNHDDLDSQPANGRDIVVDVWISVKESMPVAKDKCAT